MPIVVVDVEFSTVVVVMGGMVIGGNGISEGNVGGCGNISPPSFWACMVGGMAKRASKQNDRIFLFIGTLLSGYRTPNVSCQRTKIALFQATSFSYSAYEAVPRREVLQGVLFGLFPDSAIENALKT
ncbi:MAG: hypothetical protein Q7R93_05180 [bacterium]|nr:hypothetical protein [bacterium]